MKLVFAIAASVAIGGCAVWLELASVALVVSSSPARPEQLSVLVQGRLEALSAPP
jgi:hypothetical protein